MRNLNILIIFILTLFSIECNNAIKNNRKQSNFTEVNDLFLIKDSCDLNYPSKAFPGSISDISLTDSFIYVISQMQDFPLVKFYRDGHFIKIVSRIGIGPGDIRNRLTHKIAVNDSLLAVCESGLNYLAIYKNDHFFIDKYFNDNVYETLSVKMVDVKFLDKDHLLICNYGNATHHLLVVKIEGKNLKIIQKLYPLPPSASLLRIFGWDAYHGLNKSGNSFISNFAYPPYIIESYFNGEKLIIKKIIKNLKFKDYQQVDSTLTLKSISGKSNEAKISLNYAISKYRWVTKINKYFIGIFYYYSDETVYIKGHSHKKGYHNLFVIKDKKVTLERKISSRTAAGILAFDDKIIYYFYPYEDREIVRLYFLTLNEKNPIFAGRN